MIAKYYKINHCDVKDVKQYKAHKPPHGISPV